MKQITFANYKELLKPFSIVAYGESDHIGPFDGYVTRVTMQDDDYFLNGLLIEQVFEMYDWVWLIEIEQENYNDS